MAYLDRYKIGFTCKDGNPQLVPPEGLTWRVKQVLIHVQARRAEIIEYYMRDAPPPPVELPEVESREDVIQRVELEAVRLGKKCYVLDREGYVIEVADVSNGKKARQRFFENAKYVCVEGASEWTELPT